MAKELVIVEAWVGDVERRGQGLGCLLSWGGEREIACGSPLSSI